MEPALTPDDSEMLGSVTGFRFIAAPPSALAPDSGVKAGAVSRFGLQSADPAGFRFAHSRDFASS